MLAKRFLLSCARPATAVAIALFLAACGSNRHFLLVKTEPSAADIFVNGRLVGQGPEKRIELDFDESPRAYIQVSSKGRRPTLEIFSIETLPPSGEKRISLQ